MEARVSITFDGRIRFDGEAIAAFGGRGIEFVEFVDERAKRTTGRWLTSEEKRALKKGGGRGPACTPDSCRVKFRALAEKLRPVRQLMRATRKPVTQIGNVHYPDFLRDMGIRTRKERRYKARLSNSASDCIIVRIT